MSLEACLPPELRTSTITRIAAGLSGAGVYRVEAEGRAFVLKIARPDESLARWRGKLEVQRLAADAGVAPRVVHADEDRRAIVSDLVVDRGFMPRYMQVRDESIAMLGRSIRALHDVPLPADLETRTAHDLLAVVWPGLVGLALPPFVADAVASVLAAPIPPSRLVLCHNDLNPSNLMFDGERIVLLDWDQAGPNDPLQDLATLAMFLRMDEPTVLALLSAYEGAPVTAIDPSFSARRRLVAVACGAIFLHLGRIGANEASLSLAECYAKMRTGELAVAAPEGQWTLGLALIRESLTSRGSR